MKFASEVNTSPIPSGTVSGNLTVTGNLSTTGTTTSTGATSAGAVTVSNDLITPVFTNVVATNAVTVSRSNGTSQLLNLAAATGTVRLTLSGFAAGDQLELVVLQKASSPVDVYWEAGGNTVNWVGGVRPVVSTGASALDRMFFVCKAATVFLAYTAQAHVQVPKPPAGTLVNTNNSICSGLVAVWLLAEGSGTSVADSSGNGITGTISGSALPTWGTGTYGPCVTFAATGSGVLSATNASFTIQPFTAFMSVIPADTNGNHFWLDPCTNGNIVLSISAAHHWLLGANQGSTDPAAATQQFITCQHGSAANGGSIYTGTTATTGSLGTTGFSTSNAFCIGNYGTGSTPASGKVDFVYIWNRALSSGEITTLCGNPFGALFS